MPTNKLSYSLLIGLSSLLYFYFFYFTLRTDSWTILTLFTLLFIAYLLLMKNGSSIDFRWLLVISLLFRLIPFFSLPNLSDDFYRFIWDGRLWAAGINPFADLPTEVIKNSSLVKFGITDKLFNLINSPTHYTVYPAIPQYINWLAAKFFSQSIFYSVLLMRAITILVEMGSLFFLYLLMKKYKIKLKWLAVYALNPLVIIELSGNLHHEALMIFFLLGFLYFKSENKVGSAAAMLAFSVASKLLPLMFLPLIILQIKNKARFISIFVIVSVLLFAPLVDASFITGMKDSLTLYYQNFEFNAGIYYLFREVGYWIYGYNAIALIGKLFLLISTGLILLFTFRKSNRNYSSSYSFTLIYLIFAIFSLILHPWYIILLIALAPLTHLKFPVIWSYLVFLSYLGYSISGFQENYYVVALEFLGLGAAILYDLNTYDRSNLTLKAAP